jgi:hypothetical protein
MVTTKIHTKHIMKLNIKEPTLECIQVSIFIFILDKLNGIIYNVTSTQILFHANFYYPQPVWLSQDLEEPVHSSQQALSLVPKLSPGWALK